MPAKMRPKMPRLLDRKIKKQILLDGLSQGLKSDNKNVPLSLFARVVKSNKLLITDRGLDHYNTELVDCLLPPIDQIIKNCPKKVVRFLDAGAGEGNLGKDLEKSNPRQKLDSKTVNYHALDLQESLANKKVREFDLSVDRLPRNYFDVIVSMFIFQYLGDKLHALESLCNSLKVDGTLTIAHIGDIKINGVVFNLEDERLIYRFKHYLELSNPHLQITFTGKGGIFIRKIKEGETRIGLHFEGVEIPQEGLDNWRFTLRKQKSGSSDLLSISTYRI